MSIKLRNSVLNEVIKILHGPMNGEDEELDKNPLDFYTVGVLFPKLVGIKEFGNDDPENPSVSANTDEYSPGETNDIDENIKKNRTELEAKAVGEDSLELTTKFRPSAVGVSVLVKKNSSLKVHVSFANYKTIIVDKQLKNDKAKIDKPNIYKRESTSVDLDSKDGQFDYGKFKYKIDGISTLIDLNDKGSLSIVTRPYDSINSNFEIKTFTLINNTHAASFKKQRKTEDCLFQPVISISCESGFAHFEDLSNLRLMSDEDLNLKLLYRKYKTYGLGHGISVNWNEVQSVVNLIKTDVLPMEKVNGVELNPDVFNGKDILYIKKLGGKNIDGTYDWSKVEDQLREFKDLYSVWIIEQGGILKKNDDQLPLEFINKAEQNLKLCEDLCSRISTGIDILTNNSEARKAFEDANKAMFIQRVMADFSKHRRTAGRVQSNNDLYDDSLPDYAQVPYDASSVSIWSNGKLNTEVLEVEKKGNLARWRPFQLAFLLCQIQGVIDPKSVDRDTVDLIWFPTGGGKTEAYLGLTAFTVFYRRLAAKKEGGSPDKGGGVSVLMRYTLRLLNKQQFERASILICACDIIRRSEPKNYGEVRVSNGIWMGSSMTPNKVIDQVDEYKKYIKEINAEGKANSYRRSPPILSCPCCGNRLVKEIISDEIIGRWGYFQEKNLKNIGTGPFLIGCTNTKCDYHVTATNYKNNKNKTLPIFEVDEVIYKQRPSLLFSTVDKFVQLAWNSSCFSLFNLEFNNGHMARVYPAPDLIIQDELHLISSALGTIYGVYEIVIDKLCRELNGNIAKIVGASATVRNAAEQCKRLYARNKFVQFPPPGIDADDSFYSKKITDKDPKNRLYVGFMPSGVTTSTALIRLASVLLERIPTINASNEELDKYYTLIVYFNALRELGKFRTFLTDDIVAYRKLLANHFKTFIKPFDNGSLCELSSVMTADEITTGLDRLEKVTLPFEPSTKDALVEKLFNSGIRTIQSLKMAQGNLWKELFLTESCFKMIGLTFTGDGKTDYNNFMSHAKTLIPDGVGPIQIAPATNMISVGVDIPRLNTMIINGQPKTTAEYIQASSRVGRDGPGIVFTFLSPTKNRDRSHYEQFKSFHQAYYYHVESSSVTPFSSPALEKVLPTVLIALTRSLFLNGEKMVLSANGESYKNFITEILNEVKERGKSVYDEKYSAEINLTIDNIYHDYFKKIQALTGHRKLADYLDYLQRDPNTNSWKPNMMKHLSFYNAPSQFVEYVLTEYIPTMQTLRNVESSTLISIKN